MTLTWTIVLIAVVTALACAILGVFLVLRRLSMVAEGVGHAILPGLVIALVLSGSFQSPFLIIGPALMGLLLVVGVEALNRTRLFAGDAPLGVLFPAIFSIGVIIVSRRYAGVPLSEHTILTGDINFAALNNLVVRGSTLGPRTLYSMGTILLLNLVYVTLFFKELKVTTFDPELAVSLGFSPARIHYSFMVMVSITIVGAFDAVGAILVVALLTAPAAAAYLLSRRLVTMLVLSALFAAASAVAGFWIAWYVDSTTSGTMALVSGLLFVVVMVFAPRQGLIVRSRRHHRQRLRFAEEVLATHLIHHADGDRSAPACTLDGVVHHIGWSGDFAERVVRYSISRGMVSLHHGSLFPTPKGRTRYGSHQHG